MPSSKGFDGFGGLGAAFASPVRPGSPVRARPNAATTAAAEARRARTRKRIGFKLFCPCSWGLWDGYGAV
ncbi:hypothetical protein GCM10010271_21910 [Streptomyces kurssanovii]|nr:hypothetical protein GCM10010271_21910 [Streptomyces kurssanovii]